MIVPADVFKAVCADVGIPHEDLFLGLEGIRDKGRGYHMRVRNARSACSIILREQGHSLNDIASALKYGSHSSVGTACKSEAGQRIASRVSCRLKSPSPTNYSTPSLTFADSPPKISEAAARAVAML